MTQVCAVNSSFIDSFNKYLLGISLVFTDIGTKSSQTIIFFYFYPCTSFSRRLCSQFVFVFNFYPDDKFVAYIPL